MADVSARTPIFSRGSTVLDYWLAHAEGMTIQPLGARVEEVVVVAPVGRAETLVVRSRLTRRRRRIPAAAIAAVTPSTGDLLLDPPEPRAPFHVPRPSPERVATVRGYAAASARRAHHGMRTAGAWTRPRAVRARETIAGYTRAAVAGAAAGLAWLEPRLAEGWRRLLAAAVVAGRLVAHIALRLARASAAEAARARAALEARRSERHRAPDDRA
jgi:hypothetical protein